MTSLYITESGAYLRKRGGHVLVGRNNELLFEIPLERVEDVTLVDSVQISSELSPTFCNIFTYFPPTHFLKFYSLTNP